MSHFMVIMRSCFIILLAGSLCTPAVASDFFAQTFASFKSAFSRTKKTAPIESGVTCAICDEDLFNKSDLRIAPCWHIYHFACLGGWYATGKHQCPTCRQENPAQEGKTVEPSEGNIGLITILQTEIYATRGLRAAKDRAERESKVAHAAARRAIQERDALERQYDTLERQRDALRRQYDALNRQYAEAWAEIEKRKRSSSVKLASLLTPRKAFCACSAAFFIAGAVLPRSTLDKDAVVVVPVSLGIGLVVAACNMDRVRAPSKSTFLELSKVSVGLGSILVSGYASGFGLRYAASAFMQQGQTK